MLPIQNYMVRLRLKYGNYDNAFGVSVDGSQAGGFYGRNFSRTTTSANPNGVWNIPRQIKLAVV